ncbi:MAG: hypothetical protein HYY17_10130 [Planctomycetes bacterium]|nr:hypothetical protein [Planctomycetota bacterium]
MLHEAMDDGFLTSPRTDDGVPCEIWDAVAGVLAEVATPGPRRIDAGGGRNAPRRVSRKAPDGRDDHEWALRTIRRISRFLVVGTVRRKGDAADATRHVLKGAVRSADELGLRPTDAIAAAACGALDAVGEIDGGAAARIHQVLMKSLSGVAKVLRTTRTEKAEAMSA